MWEGPRELRRGLGSWGGAWGAGEGAWGAGGGAWEIWEGPGELGAGDPGRTLSPPTQERPDWVSLNDSLASLDDCRAVSLAP